MFKTDREMSTSFEIRVQDILILINKYILLGLLLKVFIP